MMMIKRVPHQQSLFLGIVWMLSCCVWVSCSANVQQHSSSEVFYRQGMRACLAKDYEIALQSLRKIHPESPFYSKSLHIIQKIVYLKVKTSYQQKNYARALYRLEKLQMNNLYYPWAQSLKNKIEFQMAVQHYQKTQGAEKQEAFHALNQLAREARKPETAKQMIHLIADEMGQVNSIHEIFALLEFFKTIISLHNKPQVLQTALQRSLNLYTQFSNSPKLRVQLLTLIGNLKLRLQGTSI